jgi:hypothetical protein
MDALIVRFITKDNIIGNERHLEVKSLGDGRFEYSTEVRAPAVLNEYTAQIVYSGGHVLTTTPFEVR